MRWGSKAHCHWIVGKNRLRQDSQCSFLSSNLELIWSFRVKGRAARRDHRPGGVWMTVMSGEMLLDQRQGRTRPFLTANALLKY